MSATRGFTWGPRALPEFLSEQLAVHGFAAGDAAKCARLINGQSNDTEAASLFVDLGSCKFLEGDIDGAIAAWRHAIGSRHDDAAARALLNTGLLYEQTRLTKRAINVLSSVEARGVEAYRPSASMAMARCQHALGEFDAAMETMARLAQATMANQPDSPHLGEALLGLGDAAFDAQRLDRAERAWHVASAGPASDAQQAATNRLVPLLLDQGDDEGLIEVFNRGGDLGLHVSGMLDRLEVVLRSGDEASAIALATSLDGHDLSATNRLRLAELRLELGSVNEAIDELEVLLADNAPNVQQQATLVLGQVYQAHQMDDVAVSMYERVIDSGDRYWSNKAALALGDLLHTQGAIDAARLYWEQAAESKLTAVQSQARVRLRASETTAAPAKIPSSRRDDGTQVDAGQTNGLRVSATQAESDPSDVATGASVAHDPTVVVLASLEREPSESSSSTRLGRAAERNEPVVISLVDSDTADASLLAAAKEAEPTTSAPVAAAAVQSATAGDLPAKVSDDLRPVPGQNTTGKPPAVEQGVNGGAASDDRVAANEPVVVVLSELEESLADPADSAGVSAFAPAGRSSFFSSQLGDFTESLENPYAALAPAGHEDDVAPSALNPYAELAPNFADDHFEPASDVEPGDWESMLDDWPKRSADAPPVKKPKRRPSAFSRYT